MFIISIISSYVKYLTKFYKIDRRMYNVINDMP